MGAITWNPMLWFDVADPAEIKQPVEIIDDVPGRRKRRVLVCSVCRHRITDQDLRCAIGGSHDHRFFNPHGIVFHIGCFKDAPGCVTEGESSAEFTWFKGYLWRIANCRGCQVHLGWRFSSDGGGFYGLVLNRLATAETEDDED